jgi:hypothetical protein
MAKSKQLSVSNKQFVHGGKNKMASKGSAGPQVPGHSAQMGHGGGKFAKGGTTKMFGPQKSKPVYPC